MVNMSLDRMYLLRASTHDKYVFRSYVFVTSIYTMVNMSLDRMNLLPASTHGKYVFRPYEFVTSICTW
jgi:hypothetical protein